MVNDPAGHAEQLVDPVLVWENPEEHLVHVSEPSEAEYWPEAQLEHALEPKAENFPAGQLEHAVADANEKVPAGQLAHEEPDR